MIATPRRGDRPRSLRILFAVHAPWDPRWGLPQGLIELMRQLQTMGYECEKYSEEDAFPRPGGLDRLLYPFRVATFQRKLRRHIRTHGGRFDVVVADHHLLPFPRSEYRFSGHVVARSQGLLHFYEPYVRCRPDGRRAGLMQRLGWWASGGVRAADRTLRAADQIYLNNSDELAFVRDELGHGSKCVLVPNAITDEHRETLAASCRPEQKLASTTVVTLGVWSRRKGQEEIPRIIRAVRTRRPEVRFRLLGTQYPQDLIVPRIAPEDRQAVEIVRSFERENLATLLADARAGIFPSYVEGFGIGLLEMLAAGVPVAAWDVPGPRDILEPIPELLIPAGDADRTAAALLRLLESPPDEYTALSETCREASRRFSWRRIARMLEEVTLEPVSVGRR